MSQTYLPPGVPGPIPASYRLAMERGAEIERANGSASAIEIESAGDDWRLTVTRISDGHETIELISKEAIP